MNEKASCITINCGCCGKGNTPGGGTGAENVYSTEETVCGTWIDGKPIYRKVIKGNMPMESGGFEFADVANYGIDRMINLYGNMTENDNNAHITLQTSYDHVGGLDAAVNMYYSSQLGKIMCIMLKNGGLYSGSTAYAILEYTKKTDSAF